MRLTGGKYCNHKLKIPDDGVRPAQGRVREAVFSSLAVVVDGGVLVDLFAGTGAYGLEAWSRGASKVYMVEQDKAALQVLKKNAARFEEGRPDCLQVHGGDAVSFCEANVLGIQADIIIADPPYDVAAGLLEKTLHAIGAGHMLKPDGVVLYEMRAKGPIPDASGWTLIKKKKYGSTRLLRYKPDVVEELS